jgi:hypothetical protein
MSLKIGELVDSQLGRMGECGKSENVCDKMAAKSCERNRVHNAGYGRVTTSFGAEGSTKFTPFSWLA